MTLPASTVELDRLCCVHEISWFPLTSHCQWTHSRLCTVGFGSAGSGPRAAHAGGHPVAQGRHARRAGAQLAGGECAAQCGAARNAGGQPGGWMAFAILGWMRHAIMSARSQLGLACIVMSPSSMPSATSPSFHLSFQPAGCSDAGHGAGGAAAVRHARLRVRQAGQRAGGHACQGAWVQQGNERTAGSCTCPDHPSKTRG
jgi:hypothetical protein